jgi:hypothetical protein
MCVKDQGFPDTLEPRVTFQVGKWPALETSPLNRLLEDHCPRIHQEFGGRIFQNGRQTWGELNSCWVFNLGRSWTFYYLQASVHWEAAIPVEYSEHCRYQRRSDGLCQMISRWPQSCCEI